MSFLRFVWGSAAPSEVCCKVLYRDFSRRTQKFDYNKLVKVNKQANKKPKLSIILKEDVPNLGVGGQMVQVKRGYGRSLILNQMAVYATEENQYKYLASQSDQGTSGAADPKIVPFLESAVLKIEAKEGTEIMKEEISRHCWRNLQVVVPLHCITLFEPITSPGDYEVGIMVNENVHTKLKCSVVPCG